MREEKIYRDPLLMTSKVVFCWNQVVTGILHGDRAEGIRVKHVLTGEEREISCDGIFVSVGRKPATELVKGQLSLDPAGYVVADESTRTSLPGVFAAGDIRVKSLRQVVTAAADGAIAAMQAEHYVSNH